MATIVCIHGIAQEQKSGPTLVEEWRPPLAGGLANAKANETSQKVLDGDIDVAMAFYGGLFLKPGAMGAGGDQSFDDLSDADLALVTALADEWLQRLAENTDPADAGAAQTEIELRDSGAVAQGGGDLLRRTIQVLSRSGPVAQLGMTAASWVTRSLRQVTAFMTDPVVRDDTLTIVDPLVGSDTMVIIGHSLGAVVAYEACRVIRTERGLDVPLLVTLGSPLGLQSIVYPRLDPQPPGYPLGVHRWLNVADPDDFVAAEPDLAPLFDAGQPPDTTIDDLTVDNGNTPHAIGRYLTKPEVGQAIDRALNP